MEYIQRPHSAAIAAAEVNTAFDTPNAVRPPRRVQIALRLWL